MDNRKKSLLKNSAIYAIGNFSSKVLVFLLVPVYTYYLSPQDYGKIDVLLTTLGIAISIVSLQSVEMVFRYINDARNDNERCEVISNSFFISFIGITIFTAVLYISGCFYTIPYKNEIFLYVLTSILSNFYMQSVRGLKKNVQYAASGFILTLIQVASNLLLIVGLKIGSYALLISIIIANIGALIYLIIRVNLLSYIRPQLIKKSILKDYFRYGLPLIPNAVCLWFSSSIGKYYLTLFANNPDGVGLVTLSTKFPLLLVMVNSIFFMAWQQNAIEQYSSESSSNYFNEIFYIYLRMMVLFVGFVIPLTKILIQHFLGGSYFVAWKYVPLYYIGSLFYCIANFCATGFMVVKKTTWLFISTFISVIVQIAGCFALGKYSLWGVAASYVLSQMIYLVLIIISIRKYIQFSIPYKTGGLLLGLAAVVLIVYYCVSNIIVQILFIFFVIFLAEKVLHINKHIHQLILNRKF